MRLFVTGLLALILSSGCFIIQQVEASRGYDLIQAAKYGNGEKVVKLLRSGANVNHANGAGYTPLTSAAKYGHTDIVSKLLQSGANVNRVTVFGRTALALAVWKGHTEITFKLLEHRANVNYADKNGNTPLTLAAWHGHTDIVSMLLQHGANVDHPNSYKNTALVVAAREGHPKTVSLLLEHGANVNHVNTNGVTPLICAAINGHLKTVSLLLEHGANVNQHVNNVDMFGNTPLTVTAFGVRPKTVSLLLDHGAKRVSGRYSCPWAGITIDSIYKFKKRKVRRKTIKETPKNRALIEVFDKLPPEMRVEIMNYMHGSDEIDQLAKSMKGKLTAEQMMLLYLFKKNARPVIKKLKDNKPNAMQRYFIELPTQLQEAIIKKYNPKLYDRLMKKQPTVS